MDKRKTVLFIQLPLLDNDPKDRSEHLKLAAVYLQHAMQQSGEHRYYAAEVAGADLDRLDNRHVVQTILDSGPAVIAATLYAWNVERTLHVLRAVRKTLPGVIIMVGGPEVARPHPFLLRAGLADIVVTGEGEPVLPAILRALRRSRTTDFTNVAWRNARSYTWGRRPAPRCELAVMLPPAAAPAWQPDTRGVAYLETTRGCVCRCAFCCYRQQRTHVSWLTVADVAQRIRVLRRRGAREIRFIDPTFNSHPRFTALLAVITRINADRRIEFFAEIRADTVTPIVAMALAKANVRQVEVGVQSSDASVLRAVGRSTNTERVLAGIELLAGAGLATTLDVMCGLPKQTAHDVRTSVARLAKVRGAGVQLLHTLLIPGSELRQRRVRHGLKAQALPPYRVTATPFIAPEDFVALDEFAATRLGARPDSPARFFVGTHLPDLFAERINVPLAAAAAVAVPDGQENRRALLFRHPDLFQRREAIWQTVRLAMQAEPHMLWQFVLRPEREEPLDLVDRMLELIDAAPAHFLDRMHVRRPGTHRVARRVFIQLRRARRYDRSWTAEATRLLSSAFY